MIEIFVKEQVICVTGISAITYYHMRVGGEVGGRWGEGGGGEVVFFPIF